MEKRLYIAMIIFLGLLAAGVFLYKAQLSKPPSSDGEGRIIIDNIEPWKEIKSPLVIMGKVTGGNWIGFEGQVGTVELVDQSGDKIGSGILKAVSGWMELPIYFQSTIAFEAKESGNAYLNFINENPSGLTDRNEVKTIPVRIVASGQTEKIVEVYFGKEGEDSCTKLFPVKRSIPKTESIAMAAMEEMLKGPTAEEKAEGYFTSMNEGVKGQKLTIVDGQAKVDFNKALDDKVGGSCRVSAISQQVIQTLMQFPSVKTVVISIDGETEGILQP